MKRTFIAVVAATSLMFGAAACSSSSSTSGSSDKGSSASSSAKSSDPLKNIPDGKVEGKNKELLAAAIEKKAKELKSGEIVMAVSTKSPQIQGDMKMQMDIKGRFQPPAISMQTSLGGTPMSYMRVIDHDVFVSKDGKTWEKKEGATPPSLTKTVMDMSFLQQSDLTVKGDKIIIDFTKAKDFLDKLAIGEMQGAGIKAMVAEAVVDRSTMWIDQYHIKLEGSAGTDASSNVDVDLTMTVKNQNQEKPAERPM